VNLSDRLAGCFPSSMRSRGERYYRQGRVRVQEGSRCRLRARVRGSQNYKVSLEWKDHVLSAACDCLYFDSNGPCKHVWATVLAADAYRYLSQAASAADITLDCTETPSDAEWNELDEETPRPGPPPAPPAPAAWQKAIETLAEARAQRAQRSEQWPCQREILYVVEVPSTKTAGCLVLSLLTRDRKAYSCSTRGGILPQKLRRWIALTGSAKPGRSSHIA
jgi:hypothetical protein